MISRRSFFTKVAGTAVVPFLPSGLVCLDGARISVLTSGVSGFAYASGDLLEASTVDLSSLTTTDDVAFGDLLLRGEVVNFSGVWDEQAAWEIDL